jgi:hypothetical protein
MSKSNKKILTESSLSRVKKMVDDNNKEFAFIS